MNFNDIIGQSIIVDGLKRAINEDKVANGYIFSGPRGCGKKLTASVFACALNCKDESGNRPCEICSSCIRFKSNNHPNIELIKPTGASIKIKQIRQVISDVSKRPSESGYKVILIDEADKMTQEAQDAFLKTLEEPPANTVFILLVENQYSLLPTVISRCQVFSLKRVNGEAMETYLKKSCKATEQQIKLATAYSNGIIGRAVQILQDENYFSMRESYIKIADRILKGSYVEVSTLTAEAVDTRADAEEFLDFLMGWFRDILICMEVPEGREGLVTNIDRLAEISYYSSILTGSRLGNIIEIIKNTIKYINSNVGIKNSLDGMLLSIMEVCNGKNSWGKV